MPSLPTDTNDSPNYTPAQHADHHNDLAAFNNAYLPVPAVYQQDSEPVGAPDGSWWIDTDEPSQSGSSVRGTLANGYAQVTASQSSITSEVDLTGLTVTVTVNSGERIRITACVSVAGGSGHGYAVAIKEGATKLQDGTITTPTGGSQDTLTTFWVGTPSAGVHTYKLTMRRFLGSSVPGVMFADANTPAFIMVEGIGT